MLKLFQTSTMSMLMALLAASVSIPGQAQNSLNTLLASLSTEEAYNLREGISEGIQLKVNGQKLLPKGPNSRLARLNPSLLQHYDLILFVNKSNSGPYAQRLIWFKPTSEDRSQPWEADKIWKVSTGREKQEEKAFTTTPAGIFNLHPTRQFKDYKSRFYEGAAMPYSVFLDHRRIYAEAYGIAFHAAPSGAHHRLGSRASGGCIRLHYDHAKELFTTLRRDYRGRVPLMEMSSSGSWNKVGQMAYDERGLPVLVNGLTALVIIAESANIVLK